MAGKPRLVGVRIDNETKSSTDIKAGAYRYSEDPDFAILITSYCPIREYAGGARKLGAIRRLDLSNPDRNFIRILRDPAFEKHAFNANFERITLSRWLGMDTGNYLDPENWRCSAIRANVNGVFGTLDAIAKAVRSPIQKDARGKALIKFFSQPIPARSKHTCGCVGFHAPAAHPSEFSVFEDYCDNDVLTEAVIASKFPDIPAEVQAQYEADQRINDRGARHFKALAVAAVDQVAAEKDRLMGELKDLTGVDNPNSVQQMQRWLDEQGYPMGSLAKDKREEALADPLIPDVVAEALVLKGAASLSSVAKHKAALATRSEDGRIRGSLQFYGAHTGREAGRGIQPQNLPRYEAPLSDIRLLVSGNAGAEAPRIAKGSVRASIVPARDHVFSVWDYNAIEARCLGDLSGEKWVEAEFKTGDGKIYEATAATMFGINKQQLMADLKACDKCGLLTCAACVARGKGKVSDLALGYAGGAGALVTMGAAEAGIDCGNYIELHREWEALGKPGKFFQWERDRHDYAELLRLRDLYRDNRPATVQFWKNCGTAWDVAALQGKPSMFGQNGMVKMLRDGPHNRLVLPSGRSIWYRFARSHEDPDRPGRIDRRTFMGKGKGVNSVRTDTHGGKLTENITQAYARDVLFDLIMKVEAMTAKGWPGRIVLHVHDEIVVEVPEKKAEQVNADLEALMSVPPVWAPTLAVKGAGQIMERYGK